MPYSVVKKTGNRPWKIKNNTTGEFVGSSLTKQEAVRSIGHRMDAETKKLKDIKKYKRTVNNKMKGFGETDLTKKTVKINKSKKKNASGEILDSIVHEKTHILHPKMKEKNIQKRTTTSVKKMTRKQKNKSYGLFRG